MPSPPEGIAWTLRGNGSQTLLLDAGHASGSGGCNRFTGGYRLAAGRLSFEKLATTRMACEPAVMRAEDDYLAALGRVARARRGPPESSSSPMRPARSCSGSFPPNPPDHRSLSWS